MNLMKIKNNNFFHFMIPIFSFILFLDNKKKNILNIEINFRLLNFHLLDSSGLLSVCLPNSLLNDKSKAIDV